MSALIFHLITPDATIVRRWGKAFRQEGWNVLSEESFSPSCGAVPQNPELDLIEAGIPGCLTSEDLRRTLELRHPVSTFVFGDQQKTSNAQIASFLEAGADDFVYISLDERVLVAKLKAHIRRITPVITEVVMKCVSSGGRVETDRGNRVVKLGGSGGRAALSSLTQKEFDILEMLVTNERRVVTRDVMLEKLWGAEAGNVYSDCIDKHIESLRKKLGFHGKMIKTVYGAGYMFTENNKD